MFAKRRESFMQQMEGGVALFFAAPLKARSGDTSYKYRQDSTFFYLTGFHEPEAAALLMPDHPEEKFVLFVRPRNKERETWDGRRVGPDGAKKTYGADAAYTIDQLPDKLAQYLENVERFHYAMGRDTKRDALVVSALDKVKAQGRKGVVAPSVFLDPAAVANEMRLTKSAEELIRMRQAAAISSQAHIAAMRAVRPGIKEFEIEAVIEYTFRKMGATGPAYNSIVGSGVNATILHYIENNGTCADGDLLLVDAGAEVEGYSADITRTFPVNGSFTPAQKAVYDVVLDAQQKAITRVRAGVAFDSIHQASLTAIVEGLIRLEILKGEPEKLIKDEAYKPYFMHGTSHWLGLDVHDVGLYRNGPDWRKLEPGMVLTVEPGLYFSEDSAEVPKSFRGMGIRIEDDVLVTDGNPEVLTAATPKALAEVESAATSDVADPVAP